MKRIIHASQEDNLDIVTVVADMMKDLAGRRLYAKMHFMQLAGLSKDLTVYIT